MSSEQVLDTQPARGIAHGFAEHRCASKRTEARVLLEALEPDAQPLAEVFRPEVIEPGAGPCRIEDRPLAHLDPRCGCDRLYAADP